MQLSSEIIFKLIDQFSGPAKAMAAAQDKAIASLSKIDKFKAASKALDQSALAYKRAQSEAKRMAVQLAAVENPTSKMQRAMKRAEAEATRLGTAFKKQGVDVRAMRSALAAADIPVNRLAASERKLRSELDRVNQAMTRQNTLAKQREGALMRSQARRQEWRNVGSVAGLALAHKAKRFGHNSFETYLEFDKERRYGAAIMGLTDEQQKPLVQQALHGGATTRFNDIQWLEGQRDLANRGLKMEQILGVMPAGANLGTAMDLSLPEAVKQMENAIFGFKKDISTTEKAIAAATRTADLQVKASKISGMTPEDIAAVYRFGANPAQMSGMSEESLLGFGGIMKKAGIGGDMAGVAYRAMMASMTSPTRKAKEAMLANGLDFKNYQKSPDKLELDPFVQNVAAQYGVKLDATARAGLGKIFSDKKLIADPAKFTPAVMEFLGDNLEGSDAKSLKSISGMANRYRDASMKGVDTNKFMFDLMTKIAGNPNLANAIFGSKQGGRIATALGNPEVFKKMMDELLHHAEGYAQDIAEKRNEGAYGQYVIAQGAIKNLMTNIGRAFDEEGKGGALTGFISTIAKTTKSLSELDAGYLRAGATLATIGTAAIGIKSIANIGKLIGSGAALTGSAAALDGSAAALTRAALALGAQGGGIGAGAGAGAGAGTGAGALGAGAVGTGALPAAGVATAYAATMAAATGVAVSMINSHDEATGRTKEASYRPWTMGRAANLITGGNDFDYEGSELQRMNDAEAKKTPEQRVAEDEERKEASRQAALRRANENSEKIASIKERLAAQKAKVDAGKLNPRLYADVEKAMQSQLRSLYAQAPAEQGPQLPAGASSGQPVVSGAVPATGIPIPPPRPEGLSEYCDTVRSALDALKGDVAKAMQDINGMLNFSASPTINARVSVSGDIGGGPQPSSPARRADIGLDRSRQTSLRDGKSY